MNVVAIDTSSVRSLAAVVRVAADGDATVLAERVVDDGRKHGELLAGLLAAALEDAGLSVTDVEAVVVGAGPGPFTGLRVGIVTASVIAELRQVPLYGVGSLEAIAARVAERPLVVVTDARRREVYWQRFADGGGGTPQVGPPVDVTLAGVAVTGAGVALHPDVFGTGLGADHPTAAGLVQCATQRLLQGAPAETVEPRYLRRPDAKVPVGRKSTVQP